MAQNPPLYILAPRQRYDVFANPESRAFQAKQQQAMNSIAEQMPSQAEQDAEVIKQRKSRRAKSDKLRAKSIPESAQELADRTADLGDVFRLFPNDANSFIDEYLNPMVGIGSMAAGLGSVPLALQQGNYGDAAMAVANPLLAGAGEKLIEPVARAAGKYLTTQTPLRKAYKLNPMAYIPSANKRFFTEVTPESLIDLKRYGVLSESIDNLGDPVKTGLNNKSFYRTYVDKIPEPESINKNNFVAEINTGSSRYHPFYPVSTREYASSAPIYSNEIQTLQPNWLVGYKPVESLVDSDGIVRSSSNYWPYLKARTAAEWAALKEMPTVERIKALTDIKPYKWPFNPFVYKEDPTKVYRGIGERGLDDALTHGYFRPGDADFYGQSVYFSPELRTAGGYGGADITLGKSSKKVEDVLYNSERGTPYIVELPDNAANWTAKDNWDFDPNVKPYRDNPNNWSLYTKDLIPMDKARILEPSRFRGLKPASKGKLSRRAKKLKSKE